MHMQSESPCPMNKHNWLGSDVFIEPCRIGGELKPALSSPLMPIEQFSKDQCQRKTVTGQNPPSLSEQERESLFRQLTHNFCSVGHTVKPTVLTCTTGSTTGLQTHGTQISKGNVTVIEVKLNRRKLCSFTVPPAPYYSVPFL